MSNSLKRTDPTWTRPDELLEVHFEFLNRQIDNGFFNRPIIAHSQILVHSWGPRRIRIPVQFQRQTYITKVHVLFVVQAKYKLLDSLPSLWHRHTLFCSISIREEQPIAPLAMRSV